MAFDLRLLHCAIALSEHHNFARAAKAIHVSQPTLSRSIQELEQRAGTLLFDRTVGGVELTDAGTLFLQHARELTSRASDLEREMDLLRGLEKGELRIGAGTYPSGMYVDRALARLVSMHPTVRVSVVNDNWSNLLPLLRKRELDLAIIDVTSLRNDPEMHTTILAEHQGYFVMRAGHPLLTGHNPLLTTAIWDYPFVFTSRFPTSLFKGLAEKLRGKKRAIEVQSKALISVSCESMDMMKKIAMESNAIAILPLNVVIDEIKRGRATAIPAPAWISPNFGIARLAHRSLSPMGEKFVRLVQQSDAELLAWERKEATALPAIKPRKRTTKDHASSAR